MFNKAKYLSLLVLLGAWGCTSNQYASRSGDGNDDLYGGSSGGGLVLADRGADQEVSRLDNPDYAYTGNYPENGTADYYDENYVSSRSVKRQVSTDVGYNAGFVDGYNSASLNNPYYGGLGSFWPGSYAGLSLNFGYGGFRMRPSFGFGYGSMLGYSPWGYGSMLGYGYDPFGYSPWGYNSMYGWGGGYGGYGGYYDGFGGYGYGYSPWAYSRPVIVINNPERGISRTYGPRVVDASRTRNNERYNSNFVNSSRDRSAGSTRGSRDGNRVISGDTYSSPRSTRGSGRGNATSAGGRTNGESYGSRGVVDGGNTYYSRPRSSSSGSYSSENGNSNGASYSSPRSSRGSSGSPSYSVPSRSQSDYSAPTRSYSTPRSESYSAPQRTYSAPSTPSYSAPSRSYSAPSSGGGGGSSSRSSRGPR
ncbi:hypothetical protein LZD49_00760 [Dyadobacter sp. CY261]|uniref:hypothetical protein n=1 Tax=Dyadobacter sp. CY261 TaxID=2907203 RepID=UPI001F37FFB4|nr:hypothetical protein [Dyadobacter sp. CY261]MCF0068979.1 hypothetical protein [Dyadobacter sp. CY261]